MYCLGSRIKPLPIEYFKRDSPIPKPLGSRVKVDVVVSWEAIDVR